MNPLVLMMGLIGGILVLLTVLLIALAVVQAKTGGSKEYRRLMALLPKQKKTRSFGKTAERLYPIMREIPVLSLLLRRIRSRLVIVYAGDERMVRQKAAEIALVTVAAVAAALVFAFLLSSSFQTRLAIAAAAVYIGSVMSDLLIGRAEKKLLYGQSELLLDLRHEYHQTHMVIESFERAAEKSKPLVARHARRIAEVLNAVDPEDELRKYYDVAPNRYMRQLAGISYNTAEYGDGADRGGERSLFLGSLGKINEEIRMDIIRREKLDNLLAGIMFVAVAPVFMIDPLRRWGESNFPMMADYYDSKWGIYSLLILYGLILGSFIGLRMIKGLDGNPQAVKEEGQLLRKLLKREWLRSFIDRLVPGAHLPARYRVERQLRDANSRKSVRELYLHKVLVACGVFLFLIAAHLYMHDYIKDRLLHPRATVLSGVGKQTEDAAEAEKRRQLREQTMAELIRSELPESRLEGYVREKLQKTGSVLGGQEGEQLAKEIAADVASYRKAGFTWRDYLLSILLAWLGYFVPNLLLFLRRSMRRWEMQNEVDGFYSIVSMLSGIPRINVYEMLEWLHRYSYIFELQLLRSLMDYESGPWQALERLKEEVRFPSFERIIDRLQVSTELIPIRKAFDDIEQERGFAMEQRKLMYEQMVGRKASMGKLIGFLPLQATFVIYLLMPFGYMAFNQLGELSKIMGGI